MDDFLIGALISLVSVLVGHRLSISMIRRRSKALEKGLYHELTLLNKTLKDWLKILIDEFDSPLREKYSGILPFDLSYLDNIILELISVDKMLTNDQRTFITHLKNRMNKISKGDYDRESSVEIISSKFYLNTNKTGYLIADTAEAVYFIEKFCIEKKKFYIQRKGSNFEHIKNGIKIAGIELEDTLLEKIEKYSKN